MVSKYFLTEKLFTENIFSTVKRGSKSLVDAKWTGMAVKHMLDWKDLSLMFPGASGLSKRYLFRMTFIGISLQKVIRFDWELGLPDESPLKFPGKIIRYKRAPALSDEFLQPFEAAIHPIVVHSTRFG